MRPTSALRRDEKGATAVEFAIVFPLALLFIGVLLFLGLRGLAAAVANDAARDGARYASMRSSNNAPFPSDSDIASYVADEETPSWLPAPTVVVTSDGDGGGSQVTVTVTYENIGFLAAAGSFLEAVGVTDSADDVSKTATVRRE